MAKNNENIPLAERLRPDNLRDFCGQQHLLKPNHPLKQAIDKKCLHSMIFWGAAGTGKTTMARIIAKQFDGYFAKLSAVLDGVKELRQVVENAKKHRDLGEPTLLFVDEIHRFNKAQQDGFLPHLESGLIILLGATTENPSFELNSALLSRLSVYVFEPLDEPTLTKILKRSLDFVNLKITDNALKSQIIAASNTDARRLINIVEQLDLANFKKLDAAKLRQFLQNNTAKFDKGGDIFYQQLSAFHKSVRGSNPDGALYWMARMLVSGAAVAVIIRRLLAIASEDIGTADPRALQICLNAADIHSRVGDKEGLRAIAEATIYCAIAAKSNATYLAFNQAIQAAKDTSALPVPKHLCNAPTKLLEKQGYGKDYRYAHNEKNAFAKGQTYFPDKLGEQEYYHPSDRGLEAKIKAKLEWLRKKY